ncbi:hypothetical protein M8J77_016561 [Diaphorina citri]|nr:hypothetical protein M8J77_016561 [Diaphorina citri]
MNSFSNAVKKSLPSATRVSYVPRANYGKTNTNPIVDNLYLSKKCGFSLPFYSDISMDKYLCAVGDIVGDSKMVFAGKNNNLVKIYLVNEEEVNKFYDNHPQLVVDEKVLIVRKLVDNGHKIFLCNTEPGMPDSLLINEIAKYTRVVSDMKFVNLGARNERFSHLIGFRRTVFVENIEELPASFSVLFENVNYKIFVVIDRVKCFNCNGEGHLVRNCPTKPISVQNRLESKDEEVPSSSAVSAFVPSFASRTATTAVTPLLESSVSSPQPHSSATLESPDKDKAAVNINVAADIEQVPIDNVNVVSTPVDAGVPPTVEPTMVMEDEDMDTQQDKCKKRAHTELSPPRENDKKIRAGDKDVMSSIQPLVVKHDPSIDPLVFIDLIRDLKASRRKLELISDDYDMNPQSVVDILEKIIAEPSVESKIKNRLKNLHKVLVGIIVTGNDTSKAQLDNQ